MRMLYSESPLEHKMKAAGGWAVYNNLIDRQPATANRFGPEVFFADGLSRWGTCWDVPASLRTRASPNAAAVSAASTANRTGA